MTAFPWLVIAALIAINALYVAAEFAAVAVQRGRIAALARSGNRRALGLLPVLEDGARLDRYIAACQIGITFASLVAGAYGQAAIARDLAPALSRTLHIDMVSAETASFALVLLILTALQVVLGELLPKSLALQFPERTALATYLPMRWSVSVYRGFIWLLNGSGFLLLKPFGVVPRGHEHVHSPEELAVMFAELRRGGSLSPESHRRLDRGLQLSARTVRQMMTPRSEIDAIEASTPADQLLRRILHSPYSWLPVYRGTLDQIVGAVSIKAVVGHFAASGGVPPLSELVRPMPFVPDSLRSHRFVRFLQERRASKAIVVDEHGGVQGIISIEDVLWELFGEISDELKQPEPIAEVLPDGKVRLPGSMRLDEAEPWLRAHWSGAAATVGGHIIEALGRLPSEGESVEVDGVRVTITEMSPTAARWVVVEPRSDAQGSADNPSKQDVRR